MGTNDKYRIFLIFLDFIFIDLLEWMVSKMSGKASRKNSLVRGVLVISILLPANGFRGVDLTQRQLQRRWRPVFDGTKKGFGKEVGDTLLESYAACCSY